MNILSIVSYEQSLFSLKDNRETEKYMRARENRLLRAKVPKVRTTRFKAAEDLCRLACTVFFLFHHPNLVPRGSAFRSRWPQMRAGFGDKIAIILERKRGLFVITSTGGIKQKAVEKRPQSVIMEKGRQASLLFYYSPLWLCFYSPVF